jgi:aspartyl-tRNA(Asn)/glutamyl-tRNA(Gln) amidotransferase subunit C
MKISKEEVEHVALLARLKFSEVEKERFTLQLNRILEYMEKLGELDTPSLPRDLTLSNAPDGGSGLFQVPKIID